MTRLSQISMEWIQAAIEFLSSEGWFLILLLGIVLVVLALYFRYQTLKLRHSISQLYKINENCQQDALEFFHQSWPLLNRSGCLELEANVNWFGETFKISKGSTLDQTYLYAFTASVDDMKFKVSAYLSYSGQQPESIARVILITFQHILEQDLMLKQSQILISQKRLERYQLFVQHEIKNIAQFLQLLSDQVQTIEAEEACNKLMNRLKASVPFMAQRAKRTLSQTYQPSQVLQNEWINIESMILDIVKVNALAAQIKGEANVYLPRELMLEVFKNILNNFRDHGSGNEVLKIRVKKQADELSVQIESSEISLQQVPIERMFEPFWTNSESGMGLGLFLARELLKQIDGLVTFRSNTENQTSLFEVSIPIKDALNQ